MIKVTGLNNKIQSLKNYAQEWKSPVRKQLISSGAEMTSKARQDHNFTSRSSGAGADAAIASKVSQDQIKMDFGILKGTADVSWRGKKISYAVFLHEGTYKGYRKSKASNGFTPTMPKTGYGIKADHFIVRAWDAVYPKMVDNLRRILKTETQKAING